MKKPSKQWIHFAAMALVLSAVSSLVLTVGTEPVSAGNVIVTNTNDSGPGSLRDAIATAAPSDTITFSNTSAGGATNFFDGSVHTITLSTGDLSINKDLTILGPGANLLTVERDSGAPTRFRIFTVWAPSIVSISGMTITKGFTEDGFSGGGPTPGVGGGGVYNLGTLTLNGVAVSNNRTGKGGDSSLLPQHGGDGGGIFNETGTLTILNSTISGNQCGGGGNNTAPSGGGGSGGSGGGLINLATVIISNSTISRNNAGAGGSGSTLGPAGQGGGIFTASALKISNSTIAFNMGTGGGIRTAGTTTLKSTIVGSNQDLIGHPPDIQGDVTSDGFNLIETITGTISPNPGAGPDITGQSPQLNDLADNGGPTQTMSLRANSPAIDQGKDFTATNTDQRGRVRTIDLSNTNATGGDGTDIGAYELANSSSTFEVNSLADTNDGVCAPLGTGNGCTLREAIIAANDDLGAETITFNSTVFVSPGPHTISLLSALPFILGDVTIQGPGAQVLTVERNSGAATRFRIFGIAPTISAEISGLTIAKGFTDDGPHAFSDGLPGGGIHNQGALTLSGVVINGNRTGKGGDGASGAGTGGNGGGIFNSGTMIIVNSTVSNNDTGGGGNNPSFGAGGVGGSGGGIFNALGATLTILNSTVSNNHTGPGGTGTSAAAGGDGGGINNGGSLSITNSTISGNVTSSNASGGGINSTLTTVVSNSTVALNTAVGQGGGICIASGGATLRSSILGANSAAGDGPDISGSVQSDGFNLIQSTSGATINTNPGAGPSITGQSPQLNDLADNGGPTMTHLLQPTSPAIDKGNTSGLTTDQRGFARNVGVTVDIGAVEVNYVISPTLGTPQSTQINSAFGTLMKATVTESGNFKGGFPVTFTSPSSGPGGTFTGGTNSKIVNADDSGVATAPTFTANGNPGSYNVVASIGPGLPTALFALTNSKANQTITFGPLGNKTFGDADFNVSPTASSGLPVSLAASGQCTVTSSAPGTVHITGVGSCTITASQTGNSIFNAAADVSQSFNIARAATVTTVASSVNPSDFSQSVTFTVTVSSAAGTPGGTVQFKDSAANLGSAVTLNASGVAQLTTSSLSDGNHSISADYNGATNFLPSSGALSGGQLVRVQPGISINDVTSAEGQSGTSTMTFTVTLSAASNLTVTVNFATANGTATAASDYVARNGALTFNPGEVTKTIPVTINGDVSFETDETFTLNLTGPTNATLSRAAGTGTILNDDARGGFISFSPETYSVNEATGLVTVTVVRTNDVTQPATVDYATDDTGASNNCSALNTGLASQRCDYTSVFGTLKFAASETQKTVDIPINLDAYAEGPENLTVKLSNATGGAMLITSSSATVTINDSASPTPNAIDDTTNFVRQQYHDFLNRDADAPGLAFWKNNIDECNDPARRQPGQTLAECLETQRIITSAAFFLSIEFRQTGGLVRDFYVATLFRPSTNNMPEFVEFMRDTQTIGKGVVVNQGNWQQILDANRLAFMNEFVMRPEFVGLYPTNDTPTQYVNKVYEHAALAPTPADRAAVIAEFGTATTAADPAARARALLRITQDTTFQARELNRGFVHMQYLGYLRRNPNDLPDHDFGGYDFWVTKLNQFNGDFLQAEMVKAFLRSGEYRARFGP